MIHTHTHTHNMWNPVTRSMVYKQPLGAQIKRSQLFSPGHSTMKNPQDVKQTLTVGGSYLIKRQINHSIRVAYPAPYSPMLPSYAHTPSRPHLPQKCSNAQSEQRVIDQCQYYGRALIMPTHDLII